MDEGQKAGEAPSSDRAAAAAWDAWSEGLRHPQPFDELQDVQKEHWRKVAGAVLSAGEETGFVEEGPRYEWREVKAAIGCDGAGGSEPTYSTDTAALGPFTKATLYDDASGEEIAEVDLQRFKDSGQQAQNIMRLGENSYYAKRQRGDLSQSSPGGSGAFEPPDDREFEHEMAPISPLKITGVDGPKDIDRARDDELREREIELRESLKALEAREEQLDLLADEIEEQMALVDRQADNLLKLLKGEKSPVLLLKAVGIGGGAALVFTLVQVVAGLLS